MNRTELVLSVNGASRVQLGSVAAMSTGVHALMRVTMKVTGACCVAPIDLRSTATVSGFSRPAVTARRRRRATKELIEQRH